MRWSTPALLRLAGFVGPCQHRPGVTLTAAMSGTRGGPPRDARKGGPCPLPDVWWPCLCTGFGAASSPLGREPSILKEIAQSREGGVQMQCPPTRPRGSRRPPPTRHPPPPRLRRQESRLASAQRRSDAEGVGKRQPSLHPNFSETPAPFPRRPVPDASIPDAESRIADRLTTAARCARVDARSASRCGC